MWRHSAPLASNCTRQLCSWVPYNVEKARAAARWRQCDSSFMAECKMAQNIVFVKRRPLMRANENGGMSGVQICWVGQAALRQCLSSVGLEYDVSQAALLDAAPLQTDTNDIHEQFVPLAAVALGLRDAAPDVTRVVEEQCADILTRQTGGKFVDVRFAMLGAHQDDAQLVAKAQSLLQWANTFKFCPKCAQPLSMAASKAWALCQNCHRHFYPPVHPVMMCFITSPCDEKCLLVQHTAHSKMAPRAVALLHHQSEPRRRARNVFTCVAGFVDAGDDLQRAALREVHEEVGLQAVCVGAQADRFGSVFELSQFWPFPNASLMIPCRMMADPQQRIDLDPNELTDARWFTKSEISRAVERTSAIGSNLSKLKESDELFVAPPGTMAFKLISQWAHGD